MKTIQDTVFERYQTEEEEMDARQQNRIFTEYCLFLDEKPIKGSRKAKGNYRSKFKDIQYRSESGGIQ